MTREDSLKEKHSSPNCDKKRLITKNCRDKANKDKKEGKMIYFVSFILILNFLLWSYVCIRET